VEYLAQKGRVCLDVQGYLREVRNNRVYAVDWQDKLRVLKYTDILKVNEHEIDVLTDGERDLRRGARLISKWGVREVLVTLGSYGSLIYDGNRFYDIPSYQPRQVVDATGCGDTYAAGYLYARSQGASCDEAGRLAAAMCTLKLEHIGPFVASIDEVRAVMGK
jgi:sugar/nucleoside kinase (ribokinase family)